MTKNENKILIQYRNDLMECFSGKLSRYMASTEINNQERISLIAMLEELIKIKELITK